MPKLWMAYANINGLLDVVDADTRTAAPGDLIDVIDGPDAGRYKIREVRWQDEPPHLSLVLLNRASPKLAVSPAVNVKWKV